MTGQSPNRGRSVGVGILTALGVLLLTLTNLVAWTHYTLLNTEGWVAAVGPLSKAPDIAAVVSLYVVEDLFAGAGLYDYDAVARALPDGAGHLSGLLVIGLEKFADQEIYRLLISDGFNDVWKTLNRIGHAAALDVLQGRGSPQYYQDGNLTVHYGDLYQFIRDQLEIDDPNWAFQAEALRLTVLQSHQVATLQEMVSFLTAFSWILPIMAASAFAGALWFSLRRTATLFWIGAGVAVAMFLSLVFFLGIRSFAIVSIQEPFLRDLSREIIYALTRNLILQTVSLLLAGLLLAVGAWQVAPGSALRTWYASRKGQASAATAATTSKSPESPNAKRG